MKEYIVKSGQNIYDIALTLYGSVEGIFDLLACNSWLNMTTTLTSGMILRYNEDMVINQSTVSWLDNNGVVVKNGEHIYNVIDIEKVFRSHIESSHKEIVEMLSQYSIDEQNLFWESILSPKMLILQQGILSGIIFELEPQNHIVIDWGDNSEYEIFEGEQRYEIEHCYKGNGDHTITIYGNADFKLLDLSDVNGLHIPLTEIYVTEFIHNPQIKDTNNLIIRK